MTSPALQTAPGAHHWDSATSSSPPTRTATPTSSSSATARARRTRWRRCRIISARAPVRARRSRCSGRSAASRSNAAHVDDPRLAHLGLQGRRAGHAGDRRLERSGTVTRSRTTTWRRRARTSCSAAPIRASPTWSRTGSSFRRNLLLAADVVAAARSSDASGRCDGRRRERRHAGGRTSAYRVIARRAVGQTNVGRSTRLDRSVGD